MITVSKQDLEHFADFINASAVDEYIPLPGVNKEEQKKRTETCTHSNMPEEAVYWDMEDEHGHGWCCPNCGAVIQWG